MWKKVLLQVFDGAENIRSPFHKDGIIKYIWVVVDEQTRIGFLIMWCSQTLKGINMSRVRVPENVEYVPASDFSKMDIPKINFVDASVN